MKHDKQQKAVINNNGSIAFTTHNLTCPDHVIENVITLISKNIGSDDIIGSQGCVDEYLLNEPECSQEDREEIVEQLYQTLNLIDDSLK